jgi:hypothetical protein
MAETALCPFCGWPVEAQPPVASDGNAALLAQLDSMMRVLQAIVDEREQGGLLELHPRAFAALDDAAPIVAEARSRPLAGRQGGGERRPEPRLSG